MKDKNMMLRNKSLKYLIFFIGFLIAVLLTITSRNVSDHPSLILFFVVPIALVTWFSGAIAGVLISLCSIVFWLSRDLTIAKSLYASSTIFYVTMILRAFFLFILVYVVQRLKTAMEHEKELNELKSVFVSYVSHEFKNPLAVIKETYNLFLDGLVGDIKPEQRERLEAGKKNAERLLRLVADLLDVFKIEAGKMALLLRKVDIVPLINEILKDYEEKVSKKQLILKTDIQKGIGSVYCDKDKLEQVVVNILSNAIKYSPSGGNIAIKLTGTESEIRFEISDTGLGIANNDIDKLFNKYERITTEKQEGTGLGLVIAKDIVELHKGKIWAESELGKGSKFIFILPRDLRK